MYNHLYENLIEDFPDNYITEGALYAFENMFCSGALAQYDLSASELEELINSDEKFFKTVFLAFVRYGEIMTVYDGSIPTIDYVIGALLATPTMLILRPYHISEKDIVKRVVRYRKG